MKSILVFCIATVALLAAFSAHSAADQCRKLYRLTNLDLAIEPGILVPPSDSTVAHCRVRGVINRAIRFQVTLPIDNWNGRMMFSTVGGGAGTIGDTTSLLSDGYAMASTDTGHEITEGNAFYRQPEALLDYAFRGVHLATLTAKRIIRTYYARDIDYAYLKGCSNGGRAAMLEAVRFPEDYDGIIAGAPAFQFLEMIPWMVGAHRAQSANPLTREALGVLDRASIRACDDLDGIADGVIGDPRQCTSELYDIDQLACKGGQVKDCLSPGQIETARYVYEDIVDSNGVRLSPGVLPGAEAAGDWGFWMLANEQFEGQSVISGIGEMLALLMRHEPDFKLDEFDPVTDRAAIANATSPLDVRSADLSEFRERGGKLLMYQGWNDWPLRPQRAIDFLSKVESASGGARQARDFYRLFMVPGMVHCAGGPGAWQADYVRPLVAWREKDEQPQRIIATHPDGPPLAHLDAEAAAASSRRFTRPLCVYPKLAQYRGRGDENDAANFRCVEP